MKATAYKVTLLVVDHQDQLGSDSIKQLLENTRHVYPSVMEMEKHEINVWTDEHPLNQINCHKAFNETFAEK